MEELETFFNFLSERYRNEYVLCDVTNDFMMADETFQDLFCEFCFGEKGITIFDLLWKSCIKGDFLDFYFTDLIDNEYLIDIEISDKKQHFEQYDGTFPEAQKAFIGNYKCEENISDKCHIRTWKGLIKFLKKNKRTVKNQYLLEGYLKYLKIIADTRKFKKMDITKTKDLITFYDGIEAIANKNGCNFNSSDCNETMYGKSFEKDSLNFCFGIWFENFKIFIRFWEDESYTPRKSLKMLRKMEKFKTDETGEFYKFDGFDKGAYWFSLNDDGMKILSNENTTKKNQEKVLDNFLKEVLTVVDA